MTCVRCWIAFSGMEPMIEHVYALLDLISILSEQTSVTHGSYNANVPIVSITHTKWLCTYLNISSTKLDCSQGGGAMYGSIFTPDTVVLSLHKYTTMGRLGIITRKLGWHSSNMTRYVFLDFWLHFYQEDYYYGLDGKECYVHNRCTFELATQTDITESEGPHEFI